MLSNDLHKTPVIKKEIFSRVFQTTKMDRLCPGCVEFECPNAHLKDDNEKRAVHAHDVCLDCNNVCTKFFKLLENMRKNSRVARDKWNAAVATSTLVMRDDLTHEAIKSKTPRAFVPPQVSGHCEC